MRKQIAVLLLISVFLIFTGCTDQTREAGVLTPEPYELPLSELWEIAVEETGVDNETAELDHLTIHVQENGTLDHLLLKFRGTKAGIWNYFQVRVNENGKVSWQESKLNGDLPKSLHPLPVLKAVETLGSEIGAGAEARGVGAGAGAGNSFLPPNFSIPFRGLLVHADFLAGGISYGGQPSYAVYLFKNGKALLLDRIGFESKNPWCQIMIFWPEASNVTIVEEKNGLFREGNVKSTRTISGKNENASEAGAPDHIIVFLEEDLDKASYVEYAEKDLFFESRYNR